MTKHFLANTVLFPLLFSAFVVNAAPLDRERELQVSEKLEEELKDGEIMWLDANGEKFQAILKKHTSDLTIGAAIILHGMSAHADWPQTISPIRRALPEYGWTTLSIQLPVIAAENQIEDYGKTLDRSVERIEAAINALHELKFRNIVAIGHSFGAVSALSYFAKADGRRIVALVAIGLQDYAFVKPPIDIFGLIEKSNIPFLDIYGSRDYKKATDQAADRRLAAKKGGNRDYIQVEIEGADHYFTKLEGVMIKRVRGWMQKAAPGVSIFIDLEKESMEKKTKEDNEIQTGQ
jgi:dienelactone hydrolase